MLYSAIAMKGAEVMAADGTRVGALVDAYVNTDSAAVEWLIVENAAPVRLFPVSAIAEYDAATRRLRLSMSGEVARDAREAPDGIPVRMPRPAEAGGGELHVLSTVVGYIVEAVDGTVGQAEDFLVDSNGFVVRYLVLDTRNWLPERDKLVPVQWIESADWARGRIYLKITQARTRACQRASAGTHLPESGPAE
ncbi:MAG: PRC-barrel domain-containing protein [Anaerolineae bacterium]